MNQGGPIRILHVVQRMEAAGLQSFIMNIYRNINREEIQFDFLTHYSEEQFYDKEIQGLGGRIYRLTFREDKNSPKYLADLNRFFNIHTEYKIVHGHMDSLGYFYLNAAKKAGIPVRIAHAHNVLIGGNINKRIRNITNRFYKTKATKLLACSKEAGEYMFGKSKFEVVHNPTYAKKFAYNETVRRKVRRQFNIEDNIVIGHVGRFSPQKNHRFLLDVFKEILAIEPKAILLLVGDGELFNDIRKYGESIGISGRIIYTGTRNDVEELYQAMDAFVFPSLYEGFGTVAIEAQAAGLPTICSSRISNSAKATELFYQISLNESSKTWANTILSITQSYVRKDYSEEIIKSGFDVAEVTRQMVEMYKTLLRGGGNRYIDNFFAPPVCL